MSDLAIDIAVTGIADVKAMGDAFGQMLNAFTAAKDATPNLDRLQKSIKGIGSGAGQLDAVLQEIRELAKVSKDLATTMSSGFDAMNRSVANELTKLKAQVAATVGELSQPARVRGKGPLTAQVEADAADAAKAAKLAAADIAKNAAFLSATPTTQLRQSGKVATALSLGLNDTEAERRFGSEVVAAARQGELVEVARAAAAKAARARASEAAAFDAAKDLKRSGEEAAKAAAAELSIIQKTQAAKEALRAKYRAGLEADYIRDEVRYQKEMAAAAVKAAKVVVPSTPSAVKVDLNPAPIYAMGDAFRSLTLDGNNAHSMARGLASGFNLLWLTWGNLVPLFAGATISFGFTKAIKEGAAFADAMYSIKVLAGTSSEDVAKLTERVLEMGKRTPYGPVELAKGLETLTLAGVKANDALGALQPTLAFASVGKVPVEKAAETLVAVTTAYGLGAKGFEMAGDLIAKTANATMVSVADMAEGFRTSTVLSQQFGVTLSDMAYMLGTLGNIGIKGSAAGTSVTNFITELAKGSGPAAKMLDAIKVKALDAEGQVKPILEIMRELNKVLATKTPIDQKEILSRISNNRGNRLLASVQGDFDKQLAEETAAWVAKGWAITNTNALIDATIDKMKVLKDKSDADAVGLTFFASLEKAFTPIKQYEGIVASLNTALVKGFNASSDSVLLLGIKIREAINAPEFTSAVTSIVSGVTSFISTLVDVTKYLYDNKEMVVALVGVYLLFGTALGNVASAIVTATLAAAGNTAAIAAQTAAATVAKAATEAGTAATVAGTIATRAGVGATAAATAGSLVAAAGAGAMVLATAAATAVVVAAGVAAVVGAGYLVYLGLKWVFVGDEAAKSAEKQKKAMDDIRAKEIEVGKARAAENAKSTDEKIVQVRNNIQDLLGGENAADNKAKREASERLKDLIVTNQKQEQAAEEAYAKLLSNQKLAKTLNRGGSGLDQAASAFAASEKAKIDTMKASNRQLEKAEKDRNEILVNSMVFEKAIIEQQAKNKVRPSGTGTTPDTKSGAGQDHKDALAALNEEINGYKRVEQTRINAQQNADKVTEIMYKIGALREDEYTAKKLASIRTIEKEQIDSLEKQEKALKAAKLDPKLNKNASDASSLDSKLTTASEALEKAKNEAKAREQVLSLSSFEATHKESEKQIKDLQREIESQKLKNDEIGKTPAQIELQKAKVAELHVMQLQSDAAFFESFLARKEGEENYIDLTAEGRAGYEAMLAAMRSEIRLQKELGQVRREASLNETLGAYDKLEKSTKKKTRYEGLEDNELQGVIGVETAKIRVYELTAKREIDLRHAVAQAALAAAIAAAPDGQLSEEQLQRFAEEARRYQEIIDTIDKDVKVKVSIAQKEDIAAEFQKISEGISKSFGGPAQAVLDELTAASNKAGSQYASVFKARIKDAEDYAKSVQKVSTAFGNVSKTVKTFADIEKNTVAGSQERTNQQIGAYGDMAGAAAEFFDKNSEGYAIMKAAEQGFRIFQMVSSIAAMGQKAAEVTNTTTLNGVQIASDTAAGGAKMFSQMGIFAFAGIAAMLAVMASLGSGSGGSAGGVTGPGNQIGMDGRKATQVQKDIDGPTNYDSATGAYTKQNKPQKTEQEMIDFANAAALDAAANALNNLKIEAMQLTKGSEALEQNLMRVKFAVGGSGQAAYELATQGMSSAERAAYDYNQSLLGQTMVLLDIANGTDNASENMRKLASESEKLSIDLMRAQGNIAAANSAQAMIDTRGYSQEEVAMYNRNQAMREQIEAANAGASAANDAAQAEEDLARTRFDLAGKLDVLLGRKTQTQVDREAALVGVTDAAVLSLMGLVNAMEDLHTNADLAFAALERAVEAEKKLAAANLKLATELANALKSTKEAIAVGISRSAAQYQISGFLATIRAGGALPGLEAIKPALAAISKPSEALFATFVDYQRDQIRTANNISEIADKADLQVSIEQQNIDRLDAIITAAQAQLDALKGVDTSVISVESAVNNFSSAMQAIAAAKASAPAYNYPPPMSSGGGGGGYGGGGGGGGASNATAGMDADIVAAYNAYYSRDPDQAGYDAFIASKLTGDKLMQAILRASIADRSGADYARALANGYNPEDPVARFYKARTKTTASTIPTINADGSFAVGSNYVPYDMVAQIHEGEEITPKPYVDIQTAAREETNKLLKELISITKQQAMEIEQLKIRLDTSNNNTGQTARTLSGRQSVPILVEIAV